MRPHEQELARAFDAQAARFERAPVQTDPGRLARLARFGRLGPGAHVLDAGCGPGLVAEALLEAGQRVTGVDLSAEMVRRARERCARFGDRAIFEQGSLLDLAPSDPFDGAVSRFVLHHAPEPSAFLRRAAALVRPGGVVWACDQTTDPDPARAAWHQALERDRDRTHAAHLTPGQLLDLLAGAGLAELALEEEPFELDFDEWFDRGSPAAPKAEVRARLLAGSARGFAPAPRADGGIDLGCWLAIARGRRADR